MSDIIESLVSQWRAKAALCVGPDPGVQAAGAALECCADDLELALAQRPVGVEAPPADCGATEWLDFVNGNSTESVAQALAQQPAALDAGLLRWVKAQADDADANPRFREIYAALAPFTAAQQEGAP